MKLLGLNVDYLKVAGMTAAYQGVLAAPSNTCHSLNDDLMDRFQLLPEYKQAVVIYCDEVPFMAVQGRQR